MAMIGIEQLQSYVLMSLKKLGTGERLIIQSYKKDRRIKVCKEVDSIIIFEEGFENNVYSVDDEKELSKILKELARREFPRSNKLWISKSSGFLS